MIPPSRLIVRSISPVRLPKKRCNAFVGRHFVWPGPLDLIQVADLNETKRRELQKIGFTDDAFVFQPESFLGNHLMKTVAMNYFLVENNIQALSTAIRWDEQEARTGKNTSVRGVTPPHTRVHTILHFIERYIWDTIHRFKILFCSLHDEGYRSLGAKG
jgi:phosphoadenosine phosphosulfate reductase